MLIHTRATLPMRICGMCKDPAIWELQYLDKFFLYIEIPNMKNEKRPEWMPGALFFCHWISIPICTICNDNLAWQMPEWYIGCARGFALFGILLYITCQALLFKWLFQVGITDKKKYIAQLEKDWYIIDIEKEIQKCLTKSCPWSTKPTH